MEPAAQRLLGIFVTELDDRAQALERGLLALERERDFAARLDIVKDLFRTAHSLKGAAAAANVELVALVCHRLEETFAAVRDERLTLAADAFRVFFAAVDAIADVGRRLRDGADLDASPLALLLPQLDGMIPLPPPPLLPLRPSDEGTVHAPLPREEPARIRRDGTAVRVAATKLDALLARSGLLRASTVRSEVRITQLAGIRALIEECRAMARAPAGTDMLPRQTRARQAQSVQLLYRLRVEAERLYDGMIADRRAMMLAATALDTEIRLLRMLPFALACEGFERVVRDLCRVTGKEAEFVLLGGAAELDRGVIERLKDPLLHLLRNAVDHGIEPAAARRAAGKPPVGRIIIAASLRGARIEVSVADDGGGLDLAAIATRARAKQLPAAVGKELADYIFLPGFSTLAAATQISGRGVGLDAVKTAIEDMRGSVAVTFEPGRFTRFVLDLPLTLTTIRALVVDVGQQRVALDTADVVRLTRASPAQLAMVEGRSVIVLGDGLVLVASLAALLGMEADPQSSARGPLPLVIIAAEGRRVALLVDDYVGEQEVLVRPLGRRFARLPHIAGGTFLPGGRMGLILNAHDLVRTAHASAPAPIAAEPAQAVTLATRVLLADDSLTTRSLERSILEVAGYAVIAAADGEEAWRLLQENGADIVVSDVEMPRMDGFALTEAIRGSKRFAETPVILVTALASDADKLRGMQVGASAYLVKSAFDEKVLLEAIGQFL